MINNEKCIEYYYGEFKKGIFGKKHSMKLFVYPSYLSGIGFVWYDGELSDDAFTFDIDIAEIAEISIINVKGDNGLKISYKSKKSIISNDYSNTVIMGISKMTEANDLLVNIRQKYLEELRKEEDTRKRLELETELRKAEELKSANQFYSDCYKFHISDNDNPFFELFKENLQIALIYIDKSRGINFLKIDGNSHEESNGVIPFSKIHYYEKAGTIHYTTELNSSYSSFGGSLTGGTFSKKAALWGGLLLGPMGMAGGALLTHKPAKIELPSTSFNITSEVKKIDDRNVILNYYSDIHKQYIDIELPADLYNFLQTYLPEKKYDIVIELEKKSAVHQATKQIENGSFISSYDNMQVKIEQQNDGMDLFKQKLEKLKLMYDTGILNDAEFEAEKKKLLEIL